MADITEFKPEVIRSYLCQSHICPYCGSSMTEGDDHQFEGDIIYHNICCLECGELWHDEYRLTTVHPGRK